ncbi:MAG: hypothetical protein U1F35_17095 [Steroidobacteraceae bacterium]
MDPKAGTYSDHSLFCLLGFNVFEFQNRLMINRVLAAGNLKLPSGPVMVEQLFGFEAPDAHSKVDSHHDRSATKWRADWVLLARASDALMPVSASARALFWRWIRYTHGGHPKILAELEARDGLPTELVVLRPDIQLDTVSLHLDRVESVPTAPYSLTGLRRKFDDQGPGAILKSLGADFREQQQGRIEQALKDRDALLAAGKPLDAFLAHSVYFLSSGDQGEAWLGAHRDALASDAHAATLFEALSPKNPPDDKAARSIERLKASATSPYAFVLDIYLGNAKTAAHEDGVPNLLAALTHNPYVTGAWFGLGQLLFGNYRADEAWDCWDFARTLEMAAPAPLSDPLTRPPSPLRNAPDAFAVDEVTHVIV